MKIFALYIAPLLFLIASGTGEARKANEEYNKGNYATADSLYRVAIEEDPDNARLYFNLGNALSKQGRIEEAIEAYLQFEERAQTAEDKALAQYNIGTVLAEAKQWQPAELHFRNALMLNPSDLDAAHNYELAAIKAEEEQENQQQQQQNHNQESPKPSEYAKAMKKQAEKLIAQHKYNEAYQLMQRAMQADETVRTYNDFIQRIAIVDQIDSDS